MSGPLLLAAGFALAQYDEPRLIRIARQAVDEAVQPRTAGLVLEGKSPARPVFVTIESGGKVLGCRGALASRYRTLEEEVRSAATAAAAHDPRYPPLRPGVKFNVTVTVVERLEPLDDVATLRPDQGLVLRSGTRVGVVLPWEGKDPLVRLDWARRKAGVPQNSPVKLERMVATRFRG
ncbi:MAG TPA: AMMECR1 domain-containing protein [Fimbriimonas sp.]